MDLNNTPMLAILQRAEELAAELSLILDHLNSDRTEAAIGIHEMLQEALDAIDTDDRN